MANSRGERRWGSLDVLRAVAVLLVICRHFENRAPPDSWFYWFLGGTGYVGWAGVDLFFALSGFLISNLLFQEHRARGEIDWRRFLARRAFKIYPGFYFLILLSLCGVIDPQGVVSIRSVFAEFFFIQNYLGGLWRHTWSLALEEHFYLLTTLLLIVPWHTRIVRRWPIVVAIAAIICLASRIITGLLLPFYYDTHIQQTHVRIDGLFFGSLAGYLFNFHHAAVAEMIRTRRALYNGVTAIAILGPFVRQLEHSFYEQTFGLTNLSIGFSMLTLGSVAGAFELPHWSVCNLLEQIGRCSYAIYLWHYPIVWRFLPEVESYIPIQLPEPVRFGIYAAASLCMGIAMTRWIEMPMLRLRDRLFPREAKRAGSREINFHLNA